MIGVLPSDFIEALEGCARRITPPEIPEKPESRTTAKMYIKDPNIPRRTDLMCMALYFHSGTRTEILQDEGELLPFDDEGYMSPKDEA